MKDAKAWVVKGLLAAGVAVGSLSGSVWGQAPTIRAKLLAPTGAETPVAQAASHPGLSLDQLIANVLMSDPRLRVGYEDINQANAEWLTASLPPNPTLSPDYQLIPLTRPFTPTQQGGPPQFDAIVAYPIDWFLFGKRKAAMASSAIGVRKSEAEYYDLVRQRIREAALGFYDVLELKALRDLARQDVESLLSVEAIIRKAVENRSKAPVDLSQVRVSLIKSQSVLHEAIKDLNNAKTRLRAILGRNDADPNFDVAGSLDLPPQTPPLSLDEAIALAEANRPDLEALRFKVAKAQADIVWENRKGYSQMSLRGGFTRQFQGDIGFRDANSYMFGFDVGLPFFDRNQGGRLVAASQLSRNQSLLLSGLVELRSEIAQVQNEFDTAFQIAQVVAQEQLKNAQDVRDAYTKAYAAGSQPLLVMLEAQRTFRETYRLYITSRANYWRASVRLSATLGKKVAP
jgi:cobalt-zinc-cadmium efflux system outer membrane protein